MLVLAGAMAGRPGDENDVLGLRRAQKANDGKENTDTQRHKSVPREGTRCKE
jgi:hypothetical protein